MSGSSPLHLRLFDYASSLEVDKRTQARGFSETQLMGQAALASALRLLDRLDQNATDISLPTLWILCGTGNNGGDGLALAYMLLGSGRVRSEQLQIFQTGLMRSQAAKFYLEQLGTAGVTTQPSQAFLGSLPRDHDIIVEALLGTGQSGALRGEVVRLVSEIAHAASKSRAYHVALDVPAGLTEDRRSDMGENEKSSGAVHIPIPDEIHSYGTRKLAAYLDERIVSTSQIIEFPIGFHPEDLGHPVSAFALMPKHNNEDLRHWFLKRPDDHKYTAGHGLLVGGSFGMEGAFLLAARSFFAAGGGILHAVLPPQSSRADLLSSEPSAMYRDGFLELGRMPHSVGVGPGLSQADLAALSNPLLDFLSEWSRSDPQGWVILDASAASLILHPRYPESARARTILTPHGGEWKALGGPAVDCADGLKSAHAWNRSTTKANAHVKGAVSTLLTSQTSFIHAKPNPSLAAAGSGDCLTGIFLAAASRRHSNAPRVEDIAGASADLLDAAARSMIHPASSDFPGAIRAVLGLGSTGAS